MRRNLFPSLLVLGMIGGCRAGGDQPPVIRYGEEACARCRMLINDDRFAAASLTSQGEVRKFDDIGCLMLYHSQQQEQPKRVWVRDYTQDRWLDARTAFYIQSKQIASPMGYGIAATATQQAAETLAKQWKAPPFRFEELSKKLQTQHNKEVQRRR